MPEQELKEYYEMRGKGAPRGASPRVQGSSRTPQRQRTPLDGSDDGERKTLEVTDAWESALVMAVMQGGKGKVGHPRLIRKGTPQRRNGKEGSFKLVQRHQRNDEWEPSREQVKGKTRYTRNRPLDVGNGVDKDSLYGDDARRTVAARAEGHGYRDEHEAREDGYGHGKGDEIWGTGTRNKPRMRGTGNGRGTRKGKGTGNGNETGTETAKYEIGTYDSEEAAQAHMWTKNYAHGRGYGERARVRVQGTRTGTGKGNAHGYEYGERARVRRLGRVRVWRMGTGTGTSMAYGHGHECGVRARAQEQGTRTRSGVVQVRERVRARVQVKGTKAPRAAEQQGNGERTRGAKDRVLRRKRASARHDTLRRGGCARRTNPRAAGCATAKVAKVDDVGAPAAPGSAGGHRMHKKRQKRHQRKVRNAASGAVEPRSSKRDVRAVKPEIIVPESELTPELQPLLRPGLEYDPLAVLGASREGKGGASKKKRDKKSVQKSVQGSLIGRCQTSSASLRIFLAIHGAGGSADGVGNLANGDMARQPHSGHSSAFSGFDRSYALETRNWRLGVASSDCGAKRRNSICGYVGCYGDP
ncbi:hypothetical protein C8F04DRAFT_1325132 [Mycena alexandri]|uniref:Uncharacterized protein n=1 Tax=Mycena alexandri TaxID=1745969 RepID=A0AAD6T4P6_9AGAR|nr:hypothetical protein C8F04DRAFT_1325132 [Mycena alexandri]